jgi:hypothetical protein
MHSYRTVAIACIVALLAGCHKMVTVYPGQYHNQKGGNKAVVVTNDGHEYEYASFQINHDYFIGRGGRATGTLRGPVPSRIPLADITVLKVQKLDAAKTALLATTLTAATVAIIVLAVNQNGSSSPPPPPSSGGINYSCPYIFSFDGKNYRFDSENYAGAIFAAAERPDYDNLDFLTPVKGQYRLEIRNERQETDYTNQLALFVVDHPAGTRLVPDSRGTPYALSEMKPPTRAIDFANRNVRDLVARSDHVFWQSELSSASLKQQGNFRDGVVLTFPVPSRPERAKLLVRLRNTGLGPFALKSFLELQGSGLYRWYTKANNSPTLVAEMKRWFLRDGMLQVNLWENGKWVLQDALPDVGPALEKDIVAKVDLSRCEGNEVKIKLESSVGLWRIYAVALGEAPDEPLQVTRLAPAWARTRNGRNIRAVLARDDGLYYIALPGDSADVTFDAPPLKPGKARTCVLKSKGFYYIYADDTGPVQTQLAASILNEPGLAARYFVPQWVAQQKKKGL